MRSRTRSGTATPTKSNRPHMDGSRSPDAATGHAWTTLLTPPEMAVALGDRIRRRRLALGYTQVDAALRAGVAHRTWRRLEAEGKASIDDLVRAAVALQCEQGVAALFPKPAARSMDELLRRQRSEVGKPRRQRAPKRNRTT